MKWNVTAGERRRTPRSDIGVAIDGQLKHGSGHSIPFQAFSRIEIDHGSAGTLLQKVRDEGTSAKATTAAKKARNAAAGQKEMLMPIAEKRQAKEAVAKKPTARSHRKTA